jgi:hypothetical protein
MKAKKPPIEFSVYCWDGWQRGHLADFNRQTAAVRLAKSEAETGLLGDLYYVQRQSDKFIVAEFESGFF